METVQEVSSAIYVDYSSDSNEKTLDPATVLLISKILIEVIKALIECHKGKTELAKFAIRNPSFRGKLFLANLIRKHCKDTEVDPKKLRGVFLKHIVPTNKLNKIFEEVADGH